MKYFKTSKSINKSTMGKYRVDKEISGASTLPAAFYFDPSTFDDLRRKIFPGSWQFIGTAKMLASNRIYPLTLLEGYLDEPLVLTKDKDDTFHCLSNVCTHRGNIISEHPGNQKKLVCGYHGRRFSLDGSFEYMPEFEGVKKFPRDCENLHKVDLSNWRDLLFVALEPLFPWNSIGKNLESRVGNFPMENFMFRPEMSRDYLVKAHWALYCDNYLEGFHIPFVHHDLNAAIDYGSYDTILYDHCNLQIAYSSGRTHSFDLPEDHPDSGKKVAAYYFWIFPNMMFNFYPWGLSINIVKPLKMNLTKVSFLTYVYDEKLIDHSAGALLDKVEREDEAVVEAVQKGLGSRFYREGRFSPTREQGVHHFHRLLSKYL